MNSLHTASDRKCHRVATSVRGGHIRKFRSLYNCVSPPMCATRSRQMNFRSAGDPEEFSGAFQSLIPKGICLSRVGSTQHDNSADLRRS
jgi:hypothetical protein